MVYATSSGRKLNKKEVFYANGNDLRKCYRISPELEKLPASRNPFSPKNAPDCHFPGWSLDPSVMVEKNAHNIIISKQH